MRSFSGSMPGLSSRRSAVRLAEPRWRRAMPSSVSPLAIVYMAVAERESVVAGEGVGVGAALPRARAASSAVVGSTSS
jgi:hypothetical protein